MSVLLSVFILAVFATIFSGTGVLLAMSAFDERFSPTQWGKEATARTDDRHPVPLDHRPSRLPL